MIVLLFLLAVAAAAYAGIAGADPLWVLLIVAAVARAGMVLIRLAELAIGWVRADRERPLTYPLQVLVARVALWWLMAYRLYRSPALVDDVPHRPRVRPDRPPTTPWGRTRHRRPR